MRPARGVLLAADGFVAVSATGGGLAVATGADRFPPEWLQGSPFGSYLLPGLILAVMVGGSATLAALVTWRKPAWGGVASVVAGALLIGWVCGEVILLRQNGAATSPRSPVEAVYLLLGVAMAGLGVLERRRDPRDRPGKRG